MVKFGPAEGPMLASRSKMLIGRQLLSCCFYIKYIFFICYSKPSKTKWVMNLCVFSTYNKGKVKLWRERGKRALWTTGQGTALCPS
jgi:hypothetical protein